jgi:hypothetical protein
VKDELKRIWTVAAMLYFKVLSQHFPGGTEEYDGRPVRITGLRAET